MHGKCIDCTMIGLWPEARKSKFWSTILDKVMLSVPNLLYFTANWSNQHLKCVLTYTFYLRFSVIFDIVILAFMPCQVVNLFYFYAMFLQYFLFPFAVLYVLWLIDHSRVKSLLADFLSADVPIELGLNCYRIYNLYIGFTIFTMN